MKKIAIITGRDPLLRSDIDGAAILVENLVCALRSKGSAVDIYTPRGYSGTNSDAKKAAAQNETVVSLDLHARVIRFDMPSIPLTTTDDAGKDLFNRVIISKSEADFFADRKLFDYDAVFIIHMAHSFGVFERDLVPTEKTIVFPMLLGSFYSKYLNVNPAYLDAEKAVFKKAAHVQSPSHSEADELTSVYGSSLNSVFVVPRGFNPDIFDIQPRFVSQTDPTILCANVVRMQKGQHILVPTAASLRERGFRAKFQIIGLNGDTYSRGYNKYAEDFSRMISDASLDDYFEFHPALFQKDLARKMSYANLAIYPSVAETFGKAALESMACGIPTFVFDDVPAFGEFMQHDTSAVIIRRDPFLLASSIIDLWTDPEKYRKISENGIVAGKSFDWKTVIEQMLKTIGERLSW